MSIYTKNHLFELIIQVGKDFELKRQISGCLILNELIVLQVGKGKIFL